MISDFRSGMTMSGPRPGIPTVLGGSADSACRFFAFKLQYRFDCRARPRPVPWLDYYVLVGGWRVSPRAYLYAFFMAMVHGDDPVLSRRSSSHLTLLSTLVSPDRTLLTVYFSRYTFYPHATTSVRDAGDYMGFRITRHPLLTKATPVRRSHSGASAKWMANAYKPAP